MTFLLGMGLGSLLTIGFALLATAADKTFDKDNHYN